MQISRGQTSVLTMFVVAILSLWGASAQADPLTIPGYTVTDLGPGTPTFSTGANGNGLLNAPSGQIYAFPQTPNSALTPGQGIMANFPLDVAAPINGPGTNGNPANAFAIVQNATMTANGTVVATEDYGVNGHWSEGVAYAVQLNANGSWGSPVTLWSGNQQEPDSRYSNVITAVNNLGQVLGSMGISASGGYGTDAMLYNVNTHTTTDLSHLLSSAESSGLWPVTYNDLSPIAIDAAGRILLSAGRFDPTIGGSETNLLLTPDGLSAAPLEVPAPEPSTLVFALLAIAGVAAQRGRLSGPEKSPDCLMTVLD
jgi:hypothetical protein